MTPERVIADWMEGAKCATHTAQTIADAKQLCADLHAAGFALYDTRTHVAVPREPTEAMLKAGESYEEHCGGACGDDDCRYSDTFSMGRDVAKEFYRAMIDAAEEKPDEK